MKRPEIEEHLFPPFEGFPPEGIRFLRSLRRNNNREWFGKHRQEYEEFVKLPMQSLIAALAGPMELAAPEIEVNPRKSMFRIHRDTRFSRDKKPYKTHVAAIFHPRGHWGESAGLYLHIEPGEVYLGGGIYMPDGAQLKKIRGAIADHPTAFLGILRKPSFRKAFGSLEGDTLSRAPLGFRPDHPMIGWLKFKQFFVSAMMPERAALGRDLVRRVMIVYREALPLVRFINRALQKH